MSDITQTEALEPRAERVVALSKPVVDQDGVEHATLTLTQPNGQAYLKIGDPWTPVFGDEGQRGIETNRSRLIAYVSDVTGIHRPILARMPFRDIQKVTDEMMLFFG
ncbi:phage tail assembly protein [Paraburkholderia tuberum]|uniref:Phage tail assembly chaperone protein, E, or 41 or 14 n=1 Tax=Paraburkholderia tuberum TaxID=157910 RepID=A0A1H1JSE7_9BURK|nr:phage tail assembly protein [Paraburkholderia tuberum]SDR52916.1 Phage tail assembly chaperone protein, E, or 41 or 14 [Paraburkholderia tuberum]